MLVEVKMSRIAIADDQKMFVDMISNLVSDFYNKKGLICSVKTYDSSNTLLFDLEEINYDIYILDVEMPGLNGLQIAEKIRRNSSNAYILFITSHTKYALDAFEVHAYKYILKSQINTKLNSALEEIEEKLALDDKEYYIVNTKARYEKIYYKDILYIYKEGKNTVIIKINGTTFTRNSIQYVYKDLDKNQFVFIDRGCIVNIIHVMKIYSNEVYIRNGEKLLISRAHVKEVKEQVHKYWRYKI